MEVSDELYGLATLSLRKESLVPSDRRLGGPQSWSGCGGKEKISSLLLLGIEP
jgi:hypothetical protein